MCSISFGNQAAVRCFVHQMALPLDRLRMVGWVIFTLLKEVIRISDVSDM